MYSYLLGASDLAALSEAPDLASLVAGLRHTQYGAYLEGLKEKEVTSREFARAIKNRLGAAYRSVAQGSPMQSRRVLGQLYRRYEVNNLKAILRGIAGGPRGGEGLLWPRIRDLLFPLGSATVLPEEAMVQAGSIAGAVDLLRGTTYYEVLSHALKRYSAEHSLFPLEVALDLHYWRRLWNEARRLPGQDLTHAMRVVGSLVDANNLAWAIRFRVYQQLSEEELINYTLPFGYRVRDADIRGIAAGADLGSVVGRLYPTLPDARNLLEDPKQGLPKLERELKRIVMKECQAAFLGDPFHIGLPLAYLVLQDLEVEDLVVLSEAKSSMLPAVKFSPFLHTPVAAKV